MAAWWAASRAVGAFLFFFLKKTIILLRTRGVFPMFYDDDGDSSSSHQRVELRLTFGYAFPSSGFFGLFFFVRFSFLYLFLLFCSLGPCIASYSLPHLCLHRNTTSPQPHQKTPYDASVRSLLPPHEPTDQPTKCYDILLTYVNDASPPPRRLSSPLINLPSASDACTRLAPPV